MSNISQDGREAPSTFDAEENTIVYVEYLATGFQWGTSTGSMQPLATTIEVVSERSVTFEFVRTGTTAIWYKLPPTAPAGTVLPTSSGPTVLVDPGARKTISFATSSGGPYFAGSVTVSDDGVDDFLGGGGHGDAGDDPSG
jgi:hypothetical protein